MPESVTVSAVSLLPILLALIFSLWSRNVIIGLFIGVVIGSIMLSANPWSYESFFTLMNKQLLPQLTDSYNAGVLLLLVFIGGFVALMEKSGGGFAFARVISKRVRGKAGAVIAAWLGGVVIFFSDLGTPLIVGPVFRSLFDRLQLSRQKLAFIIDSTASPVAILVPFIGWGVYIMSLIKKEFDNQPSITLSDWDAFIAAIPFQFYALLAVALPVLLAFSQWDFGAMQQAERAAAHTPTYQPQTDPYAEIKAKAQPSFIYLPLLVMGLVLFTMLAPLGFPFHKVAGSSFRAGLSTAYFLAALTLIGLILIYRVYSFKEIVAIYLNGMNSMMQVAIILILAWTLSSIGKQLHATDYIVQLANQGFPSWLLPAVACVFSALISFATGSSWGTFALMMPLVIPTAIGIDAPLLGCIAAVLSGGLWGDHCSPISETTILSSTGADCNQFSHFKTQFPYAFTNGCIAILGFVVVGFWQSAWMILLLLPIQALCFMLAHRFYKRRPNQLHNQHFSQ